MHQATDRYFATLTAYQPQFTTFSGGIYEALVCRSAIHTFASHCSKLQIKLEGTDKGLKNMLTISPNPWQTTSQFLYRLATLLETDTTAFIIPLLDDEGTRIKGFFPAKASEVTLKQYNGKEYYEFLFPTGKRAAIEANYVGVLTKFQYQDDFFGSGNRPLIPTMEMINANDQGVVEGIKSSASIRFMAMLAGAFKTKTIEEARADFVKYNLNNNSTGVMMFDEKYRDVKQIESKSLLVDDKQLQQIKNNAYTYFGTNEKILMNDYDEDTWASYYEGKIEPFAVQLSEVLTKIIYSVREWSFGDRVNITASRLDHVSNESKLNTVTQLFDRGMLTQNQGRALFGMDPVEDGDVLYIRKEYAEVDKLNEAQGLISTGGEEGND